MKHTKRLWAGLFCCLLVSCTPKETRILLKPASALGTVLAQETARLAGAKTQVVVIAADSSRGPASITEKAFLAALNKNHLSVIATKAVNLGNPMQPNTVGLKAEDFMDVIEKYPDAGAIVSFGGLPLLSSADFAHVPAGHPPVLVVATAYLGEKLGVFGNPARAIEMIDAKIIQLAILDGAQEGSQNSSKPDSAEGLFAANYHILNSPEANSR